MAGPTGVGKTQVTLDLASRFGSVIVSADSRQIYREMAIGTARPTPVQRDQVPHYLIDYVSLSEEYSAGRYARECTQLLEQLFMHHDIVFLAGGSGLYIRAVIEGFDEMPAVPGEIREKWTRSFEERGLAFLQQELSLRDPGYTTKVDLQNPRRLIRALSVMDASGTSFSALRKKHPVEHPFEILKIFCNLPRKELYTRIHQRVDEMIVQGLVEEVTSLLPYRHTQAMQSVGYREIIAYLDGASTLEEAIAKIKQHTCNYAKRQLTWFRHQGDWTEFNPPDVEVIDRFIRRKLEK